MNMEIFRSKAAELRITEAGEGQVFIVARTLDFSDASNTSANIYTQIADSLQESGLDVVHERIFGSLDVRSLVMTARAAALNQKGISPDGPVTYIEGQSPWGSGLSGVIIRAVSCISLGDKVWTIADGDILCGKGWTHNGTDFVALQNIQAVSGHSNNSHIPTVHASSMIEHADSILQQHGSSYRDVIRTWFYLSDILNWYEQFNTVRSSKYDEFGLMPKHNEDDLLLPASTGVGGNNAEGTAGAMDLIAVCGHVGSKPLIKRLANSAQKDAFLYGAAFSRGTLICQQDNCFIEVSGTAAIDEAGISLYPGDVRSQIDCTFDKIQALIGQEGAKLEDICAATVFVKRPEFASIFWKMAAARGLEEFPAVCVVADICRDELLFEIDAEVVFNGL